MLCCICKEKEAKVHLTQIVGSKTTQKVDRWDLCEGCAKERGLDGDVPLADFLREGRSIYGGSKHTG